jgi:hypothetical protein
MKLAENYILHLLPWLFSQYLPLQTNKKETKYQYQYFWSWDENDILSGDLHTAK